MAGYALVAGGNVGVTTWYFVEDAHGRLVRTPVTRMDRFYEGEEVFPHPSGGVRAVEVTATVKGRRLVRVHRVLWLRIAVDAGGRCARDARKAYAALAMEKASWVNYEAGVVPLGPSIAGLRIEQEHGWQPTEAHLAAMVQALNAQAVRPPVVAIDAAGTDLRLFA